GSSGDGAFFYDARGQVAVEGKDFTPVDGQGNLSVGASMTFDVPILEDLDVESEEYFSVGIQPWVPTVPPTGSWAWIVDNDQAPNDDFVNATLIAGSFGAIPITNFGGSVEPGEPTAVGD